MIQILIYTRAECGLCREMEEIAEQTARGVGAQVERIEIDGRADLEEQFGLEVPVMFVNGRKAFKYRCSARELRRRLEREAR
jgi:hypothetical protein